MCFKYRDKSYNTWHNMTTTAVDDKGMYFTEELLRSRLSTIHDPSLSLGTPTGRSFTANTPVRASIVVPLSIINGQVYILLIKRSQKVWAARGEMSLPGGIIEDRDTDEVEAAFREAQEEIGLERHKGSVLAVLKPILGLLATEGKGLEGMQYLMLYPVVVLVPGDFQPKTNEEIETIWKYPLKKFTDFSVVSRIPINFLELDIHYLSRAIFEGSVLAEEQIIHGMTMIISTVVAIVTYQCEEPFEFGRKPNMVGNYKDVKKIWDHISLTPMKSNL